MRINPDNAPEKQEAYRMRLEGLTDAELTKECSDRIWFSAYASNNPISCAHWQCDAVYNECVRRGKQVIYKKVHEALMKEVRG